MTRKKLKQVREECYLSIADKLSKDLEMVPEEMLPRLLKKYPPKRINKLINDGSEFVAREGRCLYFQSHGTVKVDKHWIKFPEYCLTVQSIYWNEDDVDEDEIRLIPKSQREIDEEYGGDWEASTDDEHTEMPEFYVPIKKQRGIGSGHGFKLYPRPDVAGVVTIFGERLPDELTDDDDLIAFEGMWYIAVIEYVRHKLLGDITDIQKLAGTLHSMMKEDDTRIPDMDEVVLSSGDWKD